jgi:pyruvate, water dikinase
MADVISRMFNRIRQWQQRGQSAGDERVSRVFKFKYACFKDLLASNTELLNIITDFEEKLRGLQVFGMSYVRSQAARAVFHGYRMVKSMDDLSGHRYPLLFQVLESVNVSIKEELDKRKDLPVSAWVLPYSEITKEMVDWVGGKNANLGEMRNLAGLPVPEGFAITTRGYEYFLDQNDLVDEIDRIRMDLDPNDPEAVNSVSENIQRLIILARVPPDLEQGILDAYDVMVRNIQSKSDAEQTALPHVALRSSAIGEDSELSYAGQYVSILNVPQEKIIETYKYILASLYTPRAIAYRVNKGMRDEDIAMSVACIEMVESVASGVMYSRHPFDLLNDNVLVNAVCGLGPYAVEGIVTPDAYTVSKEPELRVLKTEIAHKDVQLVADPHGGLREIPVEPERQDLACITPEQARTLAGYARDLERHYGHPQDVEWALDKHGRLLMLQTRPLGVNILGGDSAPMPRIEGHQILLEGGAVASPGVGYGRAYHVRSPEELLHFPEGGILVAKHSSPEFVIVMPKAKAIISDSGSVTGHMASVAREFAVPTLLGVQGAFAAIAPNEEITVDAYSGRVYAGRVEELMAIQQTRDSSMHDTPVYETLRRVADWIVPLHLVNPKATNFAPEHCKTLHDIMRFVHELSYREMFRISDAVSATEGAGALKLVAPIPLDLHIIDLGGGLRGVSSFSRRVTVDQVESVPFAAVLRGMLHEDLRHTGPRPVDFGGFLSVVREQMFTPDNAAERFGDRSYAIISDHYLNFSSRIGYHYSVLDSYCGETVNKNYITFSFKGGAANEVRRNRRARSIASIFQSMDFMVEQREDRVDARFYKYERSVTETKLDLIGRMLQFTRQMDMLMQSEASVEAVARSFLEGNYNLDWEFFSKHRPEGQDT